MKKLMKNKLKLLLLTIFLLPVVFAANQTTNQTSNQTVLNQTTMWYEPYLKQVTATDLTTLIVLLTGLILVYLLGKFAFSLIKWAIIILAVIIALKFIF